MWLVGPILVTVHAVLGGWALAGLAELVQPDPPWPALSNPALPPALLLAHWSLMLLAAATFLGGHLARWRHTPAATAGAYAALAVLCAVETVAFLREPRWYASMAIEYATYTAILIVLFRTTMRRRFHPRTASAARTPSTVRSQQ
jgi:hypothetical protein